AMEDILSLLEKPKARSGRIIVDGRPLTSVRDRKAAVIRELPAETMIFESMSYLDNLCFNMDHRFKKVWRSKGVQKSIVSEYGALLG
ncbi:sugar ABC transporter ATP-binding protein, partial [Klebsiella oxytoca]